MQSMKIKFLNLFLKTAALELTRVSKACLKLIEPVRRSEVDIREEFCQQHCRMRC